MLNEHDIEDMRPDEWVAVPKGWKLVPIEPTAEMLEAARWEDGIDTARTVWAHMLAAAPNEA